MNISAGRGAAVFVFDSTGSCLAASLEAEALLGSEPVVSIDDLTAALRGEDGLPFRLDDAREGEGTIAVNERGQHLDVFAESVLTSEGDRRTRPMTIVRLAVLDHTPEVMVHRALGGVLAHELRTPLTTIYGGAQLVASEDVSDTTRAEAARTVAREAQRLHDVVEDLVVLARFERARTAELEPVLLQRILPGLIAGERLVRPDAVVDIALPPMMPAVHANVMNVQHAFRNLLSTALLYGPPAGRVDIRAAVLGKSVEVRIVDEGPGLGEEEASRAFDLFARSRRTTADPSGVNLAAFVSRRLIEAMGGRIWAVSRAAGGETGFALPRMDRRELAVDGGATGM